MVILDRYILTGGDDAQSVGGVTNVEGVTHLVSAVGQDITFRFVDIPILQGSTITSAFVSLTISDSSKNDAEGTWYGHDVDDSYQMTDESSGEIAALVNTSASVAWTTNDLGSVGARISTPDLASLIQEIVNRPGWVPGNSITLIYRHNSATDVLNVGAFEALSGEAGLTVDYTPTTEVLGDVSVQGGWSVSVEGTPEAVPEPVTAAATGTANAPSVAIAVPAGNAAATGAANNPTVVTVPNVSVNAGVATGTGVAEGVTASQGPGSVGSINIEGRRLLERTGGGGVTTPLTVSMWFRADVGGGGEMWYQGAEGMVNFLLLGTPSDQLDLAKSGTDLFGLTITQGKWYYVAATSDASENVVLYWRAEGESTLQSTSAAFAPLTVANTRLIFGGAQDNSLNWNGQIALGRVWDSVLTQTQLMAESQSASAVVAAWGDWPFASVATETTDISGNGRTLTANGAGSHTDHIGPKITVSSGVGAAEAATGTGTANNAAVDAVSNTSANAGVATGTGVANDATVTTAAATNAPAGEAAASGIAAEPTVTTVPNIVANAGLASGSGVADNAAATTAAQALAGLASGTGTANAPVPTGAAAANAGDGAATGQAFDATVTVGALTNAPAEAAIGTGTADDVTSTGTSSASPEMAAAAGAAFDAVVSAVGNTSAAAGVATATGAAFDPGATSDTIVEPPEVIGTGTAFAPTVVVTGNVNVTPGVATATGQAYDATFQGPIVYVPPPVQITVVEHDNRVTVVEVVNEVEVIDPPNIVSVVDSDHRVTVADKGTVTVVDPPNVATVTDPDNRLLVVEG